MLSMSFVIPPSQFTDGCSTLCAILVHLLSPSTFPESSTHHQNHLQKILVTGICVWHFCSQFFKNET